MEQVKILEKNKWIKEYLELNFSLGNTSFSFIKDQEYITFKEDARLKLANIDELLKISQITPMKKFSYMIAMIEYFYFQNKAIDKDQKFLQIGTTLVKDRFTQDFLTPFCTG